MAASGALAPPSCSCVGAWCNPLPVAEATPRDIQYPPQPASIGPKANTYRSKVQLLCLPCRSSLRQDSGLDRVGATPYLSREEGCCDKACPLHHVLCHAAGACPGGKSCSRAGQEAEHH